LLAEARAFFADRAVRLRRAYLAQPGTRTTSRIAVRATPSGAAIGMFKPGTHEVVPCDEDERCHLPHHPAINAAVSAVLKEFAEFGELSAYDEQDKCGTLRYLQVSVERSSGRVQLTLVANAAALSDDPALARFGARLWALHGPDGSEHPSTLQLHSVWVNLNPTKTNNILSYEDGAWRLLLCAGGGEETGGDVRAVAGGGGGQGGEREGGRRDDGDEGETDHLDGSLVEALPSGAAFVLPPYVFRQANMEGFDGIVQGVRAAVRPHARVVEWYAGVGVLGLSLAPFCEWVRCSDVNPPNAAFEASKRLLAPEARLKITYRVGSAAERIEDARGADTALVDPPRKGLDAALLEALCAPSSGSACAGLHTLVYVSCGFPALARDADALLNAGWRVRGDEATAHVLFTGANHIETLVVFERDPPTGGEEQAHQRDRERDEGGTTGATPPPVQAVQGPTNAPSSMAPGGGGARSPRRRDEDTPRGRKLAARRRKRAGP
jgi:23S rRNA (uracil1939-C5)-methyltransferase